jgi:hypothetical protein
MLRYFRSTTGDHYDVGPNLEIWGRPKAQIPHVSRDLSHRMWHGDVKKVCNSSKLIGSGWRAAAVSCTVPGSYESQG